MKIRPRVSVVIPCFNYGRFLGPAIESVLAQTLQALEIIVIDDGSTDDTAEVANRFQGVVAYHHQINGGLCAARNHGIERAAGDLIVFLDADDLLDPDYLATTSDELSLPGNDDVAFVYTQMRLFGERTEVTEYPPFDRRRFRFENTAHATAMIRLGALRTLGYDDRFRVGWEDWDVYLGLIEHGYRGVLVDRPLLNYRKHDDGSSMTDALTDGCGIHRLRLAVMEKHRDLYGFSEYHRHVARARVTLTKLRARRVLAAAGWHD